MRKQQLLWMATAALGLGAVGCDNGQTNVLGGVSAIAYIQRTPADTGNVFDYTGGGTDGNLFTLTPPTASGVKKNLTNWSGGDVNALDLSFDAREIVFSGKAPGADRYHVFRVNVDGSNPCDAAIGKISQGPCQITDGPADEVYPIYLPAGRIFYVTNRNVEGGAMPQFRDEYERATTAQVATMKLDGSDQILGPRNVSHRVAPTLLSDGRVLLTEWRHLGETNEGDLTIMQQDLTGVREGFGREGKGLTNSYLRAKEYAPGQLVAIGTSRDRTYQAGKILKINLGGADITSQSEANSSAEDLTPLVPADRTPSFKDVGRYYDVVPVPGLADRYLTTWSDGAVETEVLSMAHAHPDFGIYVYDAKSQTRYPVVNDPNTWEQSPIAIVQRAEPPTLTPLFAAQGTTATLIGAINVYDSTMFPSIAAGSAVKVRVSEGFSSEEGFPDMFGLSEFDGQARLGEVAINPDGSFKAQIPANTPVRLQLIDKFGMALATSGPGGDTASEPVWIQGRSGEARICGGCHEDRTKAIALAPGSSMLQAAGSPDLMSAVERSSRALDDLYVRQGRRRAVGQGAAADLRRALRRLPRRHRRRRQPELHDHRHDRHDDVHVHLRSALDADDDQRRRPRLHLQRVVRGDARPDDGVHGEEHHGHGRPEAVHRARRRAQLGGHPDAQSAGAVPDGRHEHARVCRQAGAPGRGRRLQRPRRRRSEVPAHGRRVLPADPQRGRWRPVLLP